MEDGIFRIFQTDLGTGSAFDMAQIDITRYKNVEGTLISKNCSLALKTFTNILGADKMW